jgi:uncharacterized protein
MSESKVFGFDNNDPDMQRAYQKARKTFRYFWRELSWEMRRIVPALELACVKAPFSDGEGARGHPENPQVEHMWMNNIEFDGRVIKGVLINSPNWLKTVKEGDEAQMPPGEISDWMYASDGEVFGAFTVNLMRSRMGRRERQQHDDAWGLNFGDPNDIRIVPETTKKSGGFFKSLFGRTEAPTEIGEHPMSAAMAPTLKGQMAEDPTMPHDTDERGWTHLHREALAGNLATVSALLELGADPNAVTNDGMTPLQLAKSLGWNRVVALLKSRGAR